MVKKGQALIKHATACSLSPDCQPVLMDSPPISLSPIDEFDLSSPLPDFNRRRQTRSRTPHRRALSPLPQPLYSRRMTVHMPETAPDSTYLWGYALLVTTFVAFVVIVYVNVGTYFVPYTGNKVCLI